MRYWLQRPRLPILGERGDPFGNEAVLDDHSKWATQRLNLAYQSQAEKRVTQRRLWRLERN